MTIITLQKNNVNTEAIDVSRTSVSNTRIIRIPKITFTVTASIEHSLKIHSLSIFTVLCILL